MACHNAMVDALFLFQLEPRNEVRIVLSVRSEDNIAFRPTHSVRNLID